MTEITYANQMTGTEFKRMLRKPLSWIVILVLTIGAGAIFGTMATPMAGAIAALVVFALTVLVIYGMADHRAENAFYDAYAESRGFTRSEDELGELTPFLRKGDKRGVDERFSGRLNGEFDGSLVLYTYTETSRDVNGDTDETDYPFTLVMIDLPESAGSVTELMVERQAGFASLEKLEDAFRGDHERVNLESEALSKRFEIFARKDQDPIKVRRLFSPSFIVWLTDHPREDIAFDLSGGNLLCYVPRHAQSTQEFDAMILDSCGIGQKLRAEFTE